MTDPYATEQESQDVLFKDSRTPAQKQLDKMLDERGAWEMGQNQFAVLYQIATELVAKQEQCDPVAIRHSFDGYGWQYVDSGFGSGWTTWAKRYPDAEFIFAEKILKDDQ